MLSCISRHPGPPALCPGYPDTSGADSTTQWRRVDFSAEDLGLLLAVSSGTQSMGTGSSHSLWMWRDLITSPGLLSLPAGHTSWEVVLAGLRPPLSNQMGARRQASHLNMIQSMYNMLYMCDINSDCNCLYYSYACAIEDPDTQTVVITGGFDTPTTVSVYNVDGHKEDLATLNTGRHSHACTSYMSAGTRVR